MTKVALKLPDMHRGQATIARNPARFKWLCAGRRWRKTTLGWEMAFDAAITGKRILYGAPTYKQCKIPWDELWRCCGRFGKGNISNMEATFPGGGRITFISLDDPKNARGLSADGVILDEAPYIQERAWDGVLRPMLGDTMGWALLMGTPNGHNWFWRKWMAAKDRNDSESWQVPTLGVKVTDKGLVREPHPLENPNFAFSEAVDYYEGRPEQTFREEFLAEFTQDSGTVFRNIEEVSKLRPGVPQLGHTYVMGVDWGKVNDFTVISVADATDKKQVAVDRFNQIDYRFQRGRLGVMRDRWGPELIVVEINSMGDPIYERLLADGLPVWAFNTQTKSKKEAIEALSLALERGNFPLLDDPTQKAELIAYEVKRSRETGITRYMAPEGMHDDTVMALALAWHAVGQTGPWVIAL
ncbi:MAG TPA: hypothetical protein VMW24_24655 [Sedimentisphaerales bacterium]|nr:hypothetical protein [Sedimentisphaerales bacterium]